MDDATSTINCRLAVPEDKGALMALMLRVKPPIAGLTSRSIYSAIYTEAVARANPIIAIADVPPSCGGYVIVSTDWTAFWRGFLLRHPILALQILVTRIWRKLKSASTTKHSETKIPNAIETMVAREPSGKTWLQSSATIAKIVHIATSPDFRGRGVAESLYHYAFTLLRERGVARVDAMIDLENVASVKLHSKTGWRIERTENSWFATVDL